MSVANREPMDYIVDQQQFVVESISSHSEYMQKAAFSESSQSKPMELDKQDDEDTRMREVAEKREYVRYTAQDKARFFKLKIDKCLSAYAAAKQLEINIRTAQRWVKQYNERPDSILENRRKRARKPILTSDHQSSVINFIDNDPSATVSEVAEHLKKNFSELNVSKHCFIT